MAGARREKVAAGHYLFAVSAVAVTPDRAEVVTATGEGSIWVWNGVSGRQVRGTKLGGLVLGRQLPGLHSHETSETDLGSSPTPAHHSCHGGAQGHE